MNNCCYSMIKRVKKYLYKIYEKVSLRKIYFYLKYFFFKKKSWDDISPRVILDKPFVFTSCICKQEHFNLPLFGYWVKMMNEEPLMHRKLWEWVYIAQSLEERGYLSPDKRGVGFGVGKEPLISLFAAKGCKILATDMEYERAQDLGWVETNQHSMTVDSLHNDSICSKNLFHKNVSFKVVDMNNIPTTIKGYDFCWSSCALEHLGSIAKGIEFIENSINSLKKGGIAIHTTEYNLSSNRRTIETGQSVIFRRSDIEGIIERLRKKNCYVYPVDWTVGKQYADRFIDVPPYKKKGIHLRLLLSGFVTTSIGLIIKKL